MLAVVISYDDYREQQARYWSGEGCACALNYVPAQRRQWPRYVFRNNFMQLQRSAALMGSAIAKPIHHTRMRLREGCLKTILVVFIEMQMLIKA
jgi:hypothetical protein